MGDFASDQISSPRWNSWSRVSPVQFEREDRPIPRGGRDQPAVPEQHRPMIRWMAQHLQFEYGRLLASWPKTLRLDIDGCGQVLFCHGTPRDDNECFTRLTPEDRLLPIFEGLNASLIVCGHTHMQFDRMIGKTRVVNAGSVGMPFGEPGADWLLLGPDVELRHTNYDGITAADRMRATDYPDAQEFVAQYVLNSCRQLKCSTFLRGSRCNNPE